MLYHALRSSHGSILVYDSGPICYVNFCKYLQAQCRWRWLDSPSAVKQWWYEEGFEYIAGYPWIAVHFTQLLLTRSFDIWSFKDVEVLHMWERVKKRHINVYVLDPNKPYLLMRNCICTSSISLMPFFQCYLLLSSTLRWTIKHTTSIPKHSHFLVCPKSNYFNVDQVFRKLSDIYETKKSKL